MFTGLIEEVGTVRELKKEGGAARLSVATSFPPQEIRLGDSIAVNGVCLTVIAVAAGVVTFDVSPETLSSSRLHLLGSGDPVNLERALRLSDRLGGHLVTGHVDGTATVVERREVSGNILFSFRMENTAALRYLVPKGSVAVDGISLTVNRVEGPVFSLNVIPHTAGVTTLQYRRPGDGVNVETDILGRYVERLLGREGEDKGLTLELLAKNGFL